MPNTYASHINLYDLAFLGVVFTGITFALLLGFTERINKVANRFLALAVVVVVSWTARLLTNDIRIGTYDLHQSHLPLQFSLAFGPLLYFYVLKLTQPDHKLGRKGLLHFIPVLLQQVVWLSGFKLNIILHILEFISVAVYLYLSLRSIEHYYRQLQFNGSDRYRYQLRWLHRLLTGFGLLWLMWMPFTCGDYFYFHYQLGIQAYYPLYLASAALTIWIAAVAYLRPEANGATDTPLLPRAIVPAEIKQKGIWLKKTV